MTLAICLVLCVCVLLPMAFRGEEVRDAVERAWHNDPDRDAVEPDPIVPLTDYELSVLRRLRSR